MHTNQLLAAIDPRRSNELIGAGRRVAFGHGDILCRRGEPVTDVFFPVAGIASVVVELADGEHVEAAMLGHRGAFGGGAVHGGTEHIATAVGQMPGTGWLVPIAQVASQTAQYDELKDLLFRQEQFLQAQAQQIAACNGRHGIQQRLASWLLRAESAVSQPELYVTQEQIAQLLGVQRATVSMAANMLGDAGAIVYRRGRISIVDRESLASHACACHRMLAATERKLFDRPLSSLSASSPHVHRTQTAAE